MLYFPDAKRLHDMQAVVAVTVLDENDNAPMFTRLNYEGIYVFIVDWQHTALKPIGRVQAVDPDESAHLNYSLTHSLAGDHFSVNESTGVISLTTSMASLNDDDWRMEISVTDGLHEVRISEKPTYIAWLTPRFSRVCQSASISYNQGRMWCY